MNLQDGEVATITVQKIKKDSKVKAAICLVNDSKSTSRDSFFQVDGVKISKA